MVLSAAAANSPDVRRVLRNRSRYEIANNSYARGITLTLANDVVGTGPRLQMLTAGSAKRIGLLNRSSLLGPKRLASLKSCERCGLARVGDGEVLCFADQQRTAIDTRVQLDLKLVEADQVASPTLNLDRLTLSRRDRIRRRWESCQRTTF